MKSSSASCVPTACAISFRQWPAFTQKRPDDASISRSPRSFHRYIPSPRTTIFGSPLKSRFGVNGIQYSSIESVLEAIASWILVSAWPIVVSCGSVSRAGRGGGKHSILHRPAPARDARHTGGSRLDAGLRSSAKYREALAFFSRNRHVDPVTARGGRGE